MMYPFKLDLVHVHLSHKRVACNGPFPVKRVFMNMYAAYSTLNGDDEDLLWKLLWQGTIRTGSKAVHASGFPLASSKGLRNLEAQCTSDSGTTCCHEKPLQRMLYKIEEGNTGRGIEGGGYREVDREGHVVSD
jgi:hypothetical protein